MVASKACVLRVNGVLDLARVQALAQEMLAVQDEATVVVVFAPDVKCEPVALSCFAEAARRRGAITVHGLGQYELRLLRYLGATFAESAEPPPDD